MSSPPEISPGSLVSKRMLGSEATYRVVSVTATHVDVEVIEAPGLKPGTTTRFTRQAVEAMEPAGEVAGNPAQPTGTADRSRRVPQVGRAKPIA